MTTLFITTGDMRFASSRIRAYWPARYMDAEVKTISQLHDIGGIDPEKYSAIVWQKTGDLASMKMLKDAGVLQYLDICDPVYWFQPSEFSKMLETIDGVVCCTQLLADDMKHSTGYQATVIPDRVELEHYKIKREHMGSTPVRLIWYGLWANRAGLHGAFATLERLACNGYEIELTICDDRPDVTAPVTDKYPVYFTRWDLHKENMIISAHDIALVPPYPGPWGVLKSNNKTLTAWACGLPADDASDYNRLRVLVESAKARATAAEIGGACLKSDYQAFQSANDWERILYNV